MEDWVVHASFVANFLAYANSAINPILYGGLNPAFRRAFRRSLLANICGEDYWRNLSLRLRRQGTDRGSMALTSNRSIRSPDEHRSVVLARTTSRNVTHETGSSVFLRWFLREQNQFTSFNSLTIAFGNRHQFNCAVLSHILLFCSYQYHSVAMFFLAVCNAAPVPPEILAVYLLSAELCFQSPKIST